MEGFNTHGGVDLEVDPSVGFHVPSILKSLEPSIYRSKAPNAILP